MPAILTHASEAAEFVYCTAFDSLAVVIGTSHGAYKFTGRQGLHFGRPSEISRCLTGFPLVLDRSSSVPRDEVERINAASGAVDLWAWGVDVDEFAMAVPPGMVSVNIETDGRLVWTRIHQELFRDEPEKPDVRRWGKMFMAK